MNKREQKRAANRMVAMMLESDLGCMDIPTMRTDDEGKDHDLSEEEGLQFLGLIRDIRDEHARRGGIYFRDREEGEV